MIVSIIIPTYNRVKLIKYTLDSVDPKYHPGVVLEIIVIDDASTDNTCDFVSTNYPHVILLNNTSKGAPAARNMGLKAATGQFIMYLDSDDIVGPDYFRKKTALLQHNPELDACYGEYDFFNSDTELNAEKIAFKHKYPLIATADQSKQHLINNLEGNYIPPLAIIWKRDFLLKCKGHDETLTINQDVDLFIRAIFHGLKIIALQDGTKVYIRNHSLDTRVGSIGSEGKKWLHILELRKRIFNDLKIYNFDDQECYRALSTYLFYQWKMLRHTDNVLANAYLTFARKVYWPVPIKGNIVYKILSTLFGPVNAVKIKYFLIKRD